MRRSLIGVAVLAVMLLPAHAANAATFTDVPTSYWDYTAIQYVGQTNTWMQDYGTTTFKPATTELRRYLARALVTVYAPSVPTDPKITLKDLPQSDPFWRYANVATKLGWITTYADGKWYPDNPIRVAGFDKAMVVALGLSAEVTALRNIHMTNGIVYPVSTDFPYLQLGRVLQLHFNHTDETKDITANTYITRDEAAYSLWWAKTQMSWQMSHAAWYLNVELPNLSPGVPLQASKQQVTQYALNQVGFPYIWAGEWNTTTPPSYCCGAQTVGGFDCSGFVWWTMKKNESGYNAAQFRPYAGWSLLERSSYQMAEYTNFHYAWAGLRVGDLMFFASNGGSSWSDVDHVGIYVGNNWMMHSTGSNDGVMLEKVDSSSYYYRIFVYGRRLIGGATAPAHPVSKKSLLGGDAW